MAVGELTTTELGAPARSRMPWWVGVVLVWAASRIVTTAMLLWFAANQPKNVFTGASPSYPDFARIWDGNWYWIIATQGYPSTLPLSDTGHVTENAWAFLPGYPFVTKIVMLVTGQDFVQVGWIVTLAFGLAASLALYRLTILRLPRGGALFAVALFCFGPVSTLLQVDYAEAMFAFFITLALIALVKRRYVLIIPVAIVAAFTRPGEIALSLTILIHLFLRYRARKTDPFPRSEGVVGIVAAAVAGFAGLAWPLVAWIATGVPNAYAETETVWRAPYIGRDGKPPFVAFVEGTVFWTNYIGIWAVWAFVGIIVAVALFVLFLFSPWMKRMGTDIRAWSASYVLYTLAVFFPQSSTVRIFLPVFPAVGALAVPKSITWRIALIVACVLLQLGWINIMWKVDYLDWSPP